MEGVRIFKYTVDEPHKHSWIRIKEEHDRRKVKGYLCILCAGFTPVKPKDY